MARARRPVEYPVRVREIIDILHQDGRATPEQIAVMTGLDADTVRERIAAWERDGVIRRYKAVVRRDGCGRSPAAEVVTAFIDVSVRPARGVGFDDVAARIAQFPEVRASTWCPAARTCGAR